MKFELTSPYKPAGDQVDAIREITSRFQQNQQHCTLLGVTGSGKTFTMANVIQNLNRPTLVISHNKTLVAQLYSELREFFPKNAVEYFVSYYDYYQPEAYVPQTDTFIEKDSAINEDIDRLRLRATSSLLSRKDSIVVASVSCIYGLGSPKEYEKQLLKVNIGDTLMRDDILRRLIEIRYERNDIDFSRGKFRVKGEVIDIFLAYDHRALRIRIDFDRIQSLSLIDPTTGSDLHTVDAFAVYPATHFVTTESSIEKAIPLILSEMESQKALFLTEHKYLEAQRIEQRTKYDIEMMRSLGYCSGIENYSRHLADREAGSRPDTLIDYFPDDFLLIVDESHVTLPQVRGMYNGDQARKQTLVNFGFRLPSALDNRPLKYSEFEALTQQTLFVSATPGPLELSLDPNPVQQVIRPTGLLDPTVEIRPSKNQVEDLIEEILIRSKKEQRVLVTTLTKRMSEDLARYLKERNIKAKYIHSEIDAIERVEILKALRKKDFDCLIGINLLREGLDLPEVSLVAILDADKEGFLRSETALIQTAGRAARHIDGHVILYADKKTAAMDKMISAAHQRRKTQETFNHEHSISPQSIQKAISNGIEEMKKIQKIERDVTGLDEIEYEMHEEMSVLEKQMEVAARNLQFEKAISLRDQIDKLKQRMKNLDPEKLPISKSKRYHRAK